MRFLLNIEMNHKTGLIDVNDNLFEYLNNKFLWKYETFNDSRFIKEWEEFKNFGITIKNTYDFYCYISNNNKEKFEKEKKEIIEKIRSDEREKAFIEKKTKREEDRKKLEDEENNAEIQDQEVDYDDIDDLPDL